MEASCDDGYRRVARGLFRVMTSGIFLVAGTSHLQNAEPTAQRLQAAPWGHVVTSVADPQLLVMLASIPLLVGGAMLLTGLKTRWAAVALMAVLVPITLSVQVGDGSTLGPLFKNIGLMGSLIYFATHGSEDWSLDGWRAQKTGE